jgi:hypothetical protein
VLTEEQKANLKEQEMQDIINHVWLFRSILILYSYLDGEIEKKKAQPPTKTTN